MYLSRLQPASEVGRDDVASVADTTGVGRHVVDSPCVCVCASSCSGAERRVGARIPSDVLTEGWAGDADVSGLGKCGRARRRKLRPRPDVVSVVGGDLFCILAGTVALCVEARGPIVAEMFF